MKVTIEHNGKKIDVKLTAEQIKELGLQEEKAMGWKRANYGAHSDRTYTYIDSCMQLTQTRDYETIADEWRYQHGNYFTDSNLAEKMLKRVRLMLKMQRWADEHNGPLDWNDSCAIKYRITYNIISEKLKITSNTFQRSIGAVYFSSCEIAEKAIEEFGDEIIECYVESEVRS